MRSPADYKLVDTNLFRGPRPDREVLQGVKTVFNLEVGWFDFFHGDLQQERDWCAGLDIDYVHRPLSDLSAPTTWDLRKIVSEIRGTQFGTNVPILVHCLHGEDRTGMVCAAYRIIVQGWTPEKAIDEMFTLGFHQWAYWWWVPVLRRLKV